MKICNFQNGSAFGIFIRRAAPGKRKFIWEIINLKLKKGTAKFNKKRDNCWEKYEYINSLIIFDWVHFMRVEGVFIF